MEIRGGGRGQSAEVKQPQGLHFMIKSPDEGQSPAE